MPESHKYFSASDVCAREASIVGRPPRIPPLAAEEISEEAITALNELRKGIGSGPIDKVPEFTATLLRHPDLYYAHTVLANYLFNGALAVRDRQLAILRTEWLCQTPFAFGSHVNISRRLLGMTEDEIARVKIGSSAPGWNEHEAALLKAVEEMLGDAMVSEATWTMLAKTLDDKQLLELPVLVGQYQGVAYLQNSVRVRLMDGNKGLSAL